MKLFYCLGNSLNIKFTELYDADFYLKSTQWYNDHYF